MNNDSFFLTFLCILTAIVAAGLILSLLAEVSSMQARLDQCAEGWWHTMNALRYVLETWPCQAVMP